LPDYSEFLPELVDWLRIPSISADPAYRGEVARAAACTARLFEAAGLQQVQVIEDAAGGHPLVVGQTPQLPGRPTLLCYGHYDVQPARREDGWDSDPFEPLRRGEDLFARGAGDDKGLALILIKAAGRFAGRREALPVNLKFIFEGEEESGGDHLARYVAGHRANLKADAALLCDTEMFAPGLPSITTGLRGIVYAELHLRTAAADLHSGVYGGGAPNAVEAAARAVAAWKDAAGRILLPELLAAVEEPSEAERASWRSLPFSEEAWRAEEAKILTVHGGPEVPLLERLWARPTLEIHGIRGGYVGEGAKTVIPAAACVKFSVRLVPGVTVELAKRVLAEAAQQAVPEWAEGTLHILHGAEAASVDPADPFVAAMAASLTESFGRETVFIRSGGSIPVVGLFQQELGMPSVMPGFGLPDDNLHGPNEKVHLPNIARGIDAIENYWRRLGALV
jgi:acetylornithine deacetylase/succinyl-diaminopimelate desuccinylase-like protein